MSVSQNGLGSILVSWIPEDINATGYVIYRWLRWQHKPPQQWFLLVEADTTSATITGLMAGATYSISVASTSGTLPSTANAAPHNISIGTDTILTLYCYIDILKYKCYRASHHLPHLLSFLLCGG